MHGVIMADIYHRKQTGTLVITTSLIVFIFMAVHMMFNGYKLEYLFIIVLIALSILLFSSLSVSITEDSLKVMFGPGLIRKTIYTICS